MTFHDRLFPLDIALNAEGGPVRRTEIVSLVSGHEVRNSPWVGGRRRYNAGYGIKSLADIERLVNFFEGRRGRLHAFRFRDPFDHKSCPEPDQPSGTDQYIAIGDGIKTDFALSKLYGDGDTTVSRQITKPVPGSVSVSVDAITLPPGAVSVDTLAGLLQFDEPPAAGAVIRAGFEFDTPVRFDTDQLQISMPAFRAGTVPNIPLIEVLD